MPSTLISDNCENLPLATAADVMEVIHRRLLNSRALLLCDEGGFMQQAPQRTGPYCSLQQLWRWRRVHTAGSSTAGGLVAAYNNWLDGGGGTSGSPPQQGQCQFLQQLSGLQTSLHRVSSHFDFLGVKIKCWFGFSHHSCETWIILKDSVLMVAWFVFHKNINIMIVVCHTWECPR